MGEAELEIQAKLEEDPMPDDNAIAELMATQKPTTATTGTQIDYNRKGHNLVLVCCWWRGAA